MRDKKPTFHKLHMFETEMEIARSTRSYISLLSIWCLLDLSQLNIRTVIRYKNKLKGYGLNAENAKNAKNGVSQSVIKDFTMELFL